MAKFKIKKGDKVVVLTGKDKGKTGEVKQVLTEDMKVIVNGVNGYADTRVERLVEVMHELLRDPALARRWGDAAQHTVRERFGIERFAADWDRVLRQVVEARASA